MKPYFHFLLRQLKGKPLASLILITLGLQTLVFLSFQVAYKEIFDGLQNHRAISYLVGWIEVVVAASLLRVGFLILNDHLVGKVTLDLFNQLRMRLYEHLQWLSPTSYAHPSSSYSHDLQQSETTTRQVLPLIISNGMVIFFSFGILCYYEWRLALLVCLFSTLGLFCSFLLMERASALTEKNQQASASLSSLIDEVATQHLLIQAFNLHKTLLKRFRGEIAHCRDDLLKGFFLRALIGRISIFVLLLVELMIFGIGIVMTSKGLMTIGTLFIFFSLVWNISGAVFTLSNFLPNIIESSASSHKLDTLLSIPLETSPTEAPLAALPPIKKGISLRSASLFHGQQEVLSQISIEIPARHSVAFVGVTGSGKTSLIHLILGLHLPSSGEIYFDTHEIRSIDRSSLREQMGVVFQHTSLFNLSIRENIRMGKKEATDEKIEEAAKRALIHDFIVSLPEGYETLIQELGAHLSGGQKQRIALARLFLKDPPFLLLDEHTSALDPLTEDALQQHLSTLAKDKTFIVSTHRIDRLQAFDRIYLLDKGCLKEEGSHQELLDKRGLYFQLWQKQQGIHLKPGGKEVDISPAYLASLPLFQSASLECLQEISQDFLIEWVDEGRVVFEKGAYGDAFYLIVRGSVEIVDPDQGVVATLEDGDYFGEVALMRQVARTHTVITASHCIFLTLHASQFQAILAKDPALKALFEARLPL